jgi:hypothetical protein
VNGQCLEIEPHKYVVVLGCDPAPGKSQELIVKYFRGSQTRTEVAKDGERFRLVGIEAEESISRPILFDGPAGISERNMPEEAKLRDRALDLRMSCGKMTNAVSARRTADCNYACSIVLVGNYQPFVGFPCLPASMRNQKLPCLDKPTILDSCCSSTESKGVHFKCFTSCRPPRIHFGKKGYDADHRDNWNELRAWLQHLEPVEGGFCGFEDELLRMDADDVSVFLKGEVFTCFDCLTFIPICLGAVIIGILVWAICDGWLFILTAGTYDGQHLSMAFLNKCLVAKVKLLPISPPRFLRLSGLPKTHPLSSSMGMYTLLRNEKEMSREFPERKLIHRYDRAKESVSQRLAIPCYTYKQVQGEAGSRGLTNQQLLDCIPEDITKRQNDGRELMMGDKADQVTWGLEGLVHDPSKFLDDKFSRGPMVLMPLEAVNDLGKSDDKWLQFEEWDSALLKVLPKSNEKAAAMLRSSHTDHARKVLFSDQLKDLKFQVVKLEPGAVVDAESTSRTYEEHTISIEVLEDNDEDVIPMRLDFDARSATTDAKAVAQTNTGGDVDEI